MEFFKASGRGAWPSRSHSVPILAAVMLALISSSGLPAHAQAAPAGPRGDAPRGLPLYAQAAPAGISAWVPTFHLWDAAQDVRVKPLVDGGTIPDAVRACAAIEIIPPAGLPVGSVRTQFDGAGQGCGNGTPFDNAPPFGWDTDGGGTHTYACSSSLMAVGPHTLSVTPYSGRSCSGARGPTTTIKFTVEAPGPPEAPFKIVCGTLDGAPIGAPMSVQVETSPGGWAPLPILGRALLTPSTETLTVGFPAGTGLFQTRCVHGDIPGAPTPFYYHTPC